MILGKSCYVTDLKMMRMRLEVRLIDARMERFKKEGFSESEYWLDRLNDVQRKGRLALKAMECMRL